VLGAFMVVGWIASHVAHRVESKPMQYLALAGFVVAEAIIFVPLLLTAQLKAPGLIESAAGVTLAGTVGLMGVVHFTRKDFSFLRGVLMWGGVIALIAIGAAVLVDDIQLGTWFSVAMIGFAGAAVLYDTSNILHHYPEDKHVAAALGLFASIALMFWYVLQLFISSRD
jgi:FtsH-binding integral membrane protein